MTQPQPQQKPLTWPLRPPAGTDPAKWETLSILDPLKAPKRRRARKPKRGRLGQRGYELLVDAFAYLSHQQVRNDIRIELDRLFCLTLNTFWVQAE